MATWRPVRGAITRLDTTLASNEDIENFLESERIIARRHADGDTYWIEMAATGRRRRVAVLGEEGITEGPTLADVVESMDRAVRKLHIEIGGRVAWGDIDLGEVDVAFDDIDEEALASATHDPSAAHDPSASAEGMAGELGDDAREAEPPSFAEGAMLVLSDTSYAEVPRLAAQIESEVAALKCEGVNVLLADKEMELGSHLVSQPDFLITLSVDPAGLENPKLTVQQDSARLSWHWTYDKTDCDWVAANEEARAFAQEHLGAGAFVRRMCADVPTANPDALRAALEGPGDAAPRAMVGALGLPEEVADVLDSLLEARQVPGATVFEPQSFSQRIKSQVAYEVAGEGRANPGMWEVVRKYYVEDSAGTLGATAAQAGVGAVLLAAGLRRRGSTAAAVASALGSVALGGAGARLALSRWVASALDKEGLAES